MKVEENSGSLTLLSLSTFLPSVPVGEFCTCRACRDRKRVSELLELESRMLVSYLVGAGEQTLVLCRSSQCS